MQGPKLHEVHVGMLELLVGVSVDVIDLAIVNLVQGVPADPRHVAYLIEALEFAVQEVNNPLSILSPLNFGLLASCICTFLGSFYLPSILLL